MTPLSFRMAALNKALYCVTNITINVRKADIEILLTSLVLYVHVSKIESFILKRQQSSSISVTV